MSYSTVSFLTVTCTIKYSGAASNTIFIYLFDYSMCTATFERELVGINQGVTDLTRYKDRLVLLAYNQAGA